MRLRGIFSWHHEDWFAQSFSSFRHHHPNGTEKKSQCSSFLTTQIIGQSHDVDAQVFFIYWGSVWWKFHQFSSIELRERSIWNLSHYCCCYCHCYCYLYCSCWCSSISPRRSSLRSSIIGRPAFGFSEQDAQIELPHSSLRAPSKLFHSSLRVRWPARQELARTSVFIVFNTVMKRCSRVQNSPDKPAREVRCCSCFYCL